MTLGNTFSAWSGAIVCNASNSQDQVVDGNIEAENRPAPKKRAEPKKATKKVAMKEPKKKAKPGGKQRTTGS